MNILQLCPAYKPNVGGLEFVVHTLAKEFTVSGHPSRILTTQSGTHVDDLELGVIRNPKHTDYWQAIQWSNAIVIHQDCLRLAWSVLGTRKPTVMMIHITPQTRSWPAMLLMRMIVRRCSLFAASKATSKDAQRVLGVPCGVLPVPYNTKHFFLPENDLEREIDFAFVGRLIEAKGVSIFVRALGQLVSEGAKPSAVIIGDGEVRKQLACEISERGLKPYVKMLGEHNADQIGHILRRTYCLVVPSFNEAFGIVALEARACGCKVLATSVGGLPEAVGPDAVLVKGGSIDDLARGMREVLGLQAMKERLPHFERNAAEELSRHQPPHVAKAFLEVLQPTQPVLV